MNKNFKKYHILPLVIFMVSCFACDSNNGYTPRNGDIIFHTSQSAQSIAIQKATRSPYSHMGIVYVTNGKPWVYEAVEPVKLTPLDEWIQKGEGGRFVVKRLVDADRILTTEALQRMHHIGKSFEGRHYDLYFEWSDDRIYCSELVWKIYKQALDIEVGSLETLRSFDLTDPLVQAKIRERWKDGPPLDEVVITPVAIFDSDNLHEVYRK
jgi:hypothetical protein